MDGPSAHDPLAGAAAPAGGGASGGAVPTAHKPKKHLIAGVEDVYLYTTQESNPVSLLYELECARLNRVRFTLNFEGSENFELETGGLVLQVVAEPFKRTRMGRLLVKDKTKPAKLCNKYTWTLDEPDSETMNQMIASDYAVIHELMIDAKALGFGDDSLTVQNIEATCREFNLNFLDLDFPPTPRSLYRKTRNSELMTDGQPISFRRPTDFMDGEYDVFLGGIEPNDIRQGMLSDCWFLCALSAIAEFPHLVKRLFLKESQTVSSSGVYKLRLCKNGQWQTVTVDDYFPCWPGGGPAYSRSHGNELWVLLLEKAYAKLHGSYGAIKMGWAYEAMLDLSGCPYATIRLEDPDVQERIRAGAMWDELVRWDDEGYVMSCSTPGEDVYTETGEKPEKSGSGLVAGHAYTLLAAKATSAGHKLVCLRNPWGNFEWQGAWSDNSELWTPELRMEVGADEVAEDDGKFWMCFEDVVAHFFSINVSMVDPQGCINGEWFEKRRKVSFTYGGDDQLSVPMYVLNVPTQSHHFISVHQEDERCEGFKPYLDIGVTVLEILPDHTYRLVASSGNSAERQNQTEVNLKKGQYLVVPTTTGCKFAQGIQHSGGPPVALFKEADAADAVDGRREFSDEVTAALNEMFRRLDSDLDNVLSRNELNTFMQMTEGCSMSDEVHKWLISQFDSYQGGLTQDGFRAAYMYMFESSGGDPETIWRDLMYMGYDRSLDLLYCRTVMLAFHSDRSFALHPQPFDANAYEEAMELPIKEFGKCKDLEGGQVKLYTRRAGYSGVSFAVENCGSRQLEFTLDCAESKNVMSHRGQLRASQRIPVNETKVLHHLMPDKSFDPWSWSIKYSVRWL